MMASLCLRLNLLLLSFIISTLLPSLSLFPAPPRLLLQASAVSLRATSTAAGFRPHQGLKVKVRMCLKCKMYIDLGEQREKIAKQTEVNQEEVMTKARRQKMHSKLAKAAAETMRQKVRDPQYENNVNQDMAVPLNAKDPKESNPDRVAKDAKHSTSSSLPTAMVLPSGHHATLIFSPVVDTLTPAPRGCRESHTRTVLSFEAVTMRFTLVGSQAKAWIGPRWPWNPCEERSSPPCMCQSLAVASTAPLASRVPSRFHPSACTFPLWPL